MAKPGGVFTVRSYYNALQEKELEDIVEAEACGVLKHIWRTNIPSKLKAFGLRVVLNRLPTKDKLEKRGMLHNVQDKVCVLCLEKDEDLNHLFFKCKASQTVQNDILCWLDINVNMFNEGIPHFIQFIHALQGKIKKKKLSLIWLVTL